MENVMVNMTPPATARDKWMYEQGRLAERDPRTHELEKSQANKPPVSQERINFEAWYIRTHTNANIMRTKKGYISETTRVAWRAWQARSELGI